MNCFSLSVYGGDERFYRGAAANVLRMRRLMPDWQVVLWLEASRPEWTAVFAALGARVEMRPKNEGIRGMFWRFEAVDLEGCDRMVVRDADSLFGSRDAAAVLQWEESGLDFHVVRDMPGHHDQQWPIFGGLWGARSRALPKMAALIEWWGRFDRYGDDQCFLRQAIWPRFTGENALLHNGCRGFWPGVDWPECQDDGAPRVGDRVFV